MGENPAVRHSMWNEMRAGKKEALLHHQARRFLKVALGTGKKSQVSNDLGELECGRFEYVQEGPVLGVESAVCDSWERKAWTTCLECCMKRGERNRHLLSTMDGAGDHSQPASLASLTFSGFQSPLARKLQMRP